MDESDGDSVTQRKNVALKCCAALAGLGICCGVIFNFILTMKVLSIVAGIAVVAFLGVML